MQNHLRALGQSLPTLSESTDPSAAKKSAQATTDKALNSFDADRLPGELMAQVLKHLSDKKFVAAMGSSSQIRRLPSNLDLRERLQDYLKLPALPPKQSTQALALQQYIAAIRRTETLKKEIADGRSGITLAKGGDEHITAFSITHTGSHLVVGSNKGEVGRFELPSELSTVSSSSASRTSEEKSTLLRGNYEVLGQHEAEIITVEFTQNGRFFLSAAADGTVKIEDTKKQSARLLKETGARIARVALSEDGNHLVTLNADQQVRFWDLKDACPAVKILERDGQVDLMQLSPDGRFVATTDGTSRVHLFDLDNSTLQPKQLFHTPVDAEDSPNAELYDAVTSLNFSPKSDFLVTTSQVGEDEDVQGRSQIQLWDLRSATPTATPLNYHALGVFCSAFSPNGRLLATGSHDEDFAVWDLTSTPPKVSQHLSWELDDYTHVLFSPDSRFLLGVDVFPYSQGRGARNFKIWDLHARSPEGKDLGTDGKRFDDVQFSRDSRFIVTRHGSTVRLRATPFTDI